MKLSVVVIVYNIAREAPRTLHSLSAAYQREIAPEDYEVIVVENGSPKPLDAELIAKLPANFRYHYLKKASPSPAAALNFGLREARGEVVGLMIDGARICTPGVLHHALAATRAYDRAIVGTLGYYLGSEYQRFAIQRGYDQAGEDKLLDGIGWPADGYRLFEIGCTDESSRWLSPMNESNALFMRKELWHEVDGVDERFAAPGGGLVNLDLFVRACALPRSQLVVLLGEGTFHQVHGGIATNTPYDRHLKDIERWRAEYISIRGKDFLAPDCPRKFVGSLPQNCWHHLANEIAEPERNLFRRVNGWREEQMAQDRERLERERAEHQAQATALTALAESLQLERDRLAREVSLMSGSHSWTLTRPLRAAFRGASAIKDRLTGNRHGGNGESGNGA